MTQHSSARSLENLNLPLQNVVTSEALCSQVRSGSQGEAVVLDGGRIRVQYEPEYKLIRTHILPNYDVVNIHLSDDGHDIRSIEGFPSISNDKLADLVKSGLLNADLLPTVGISQDEIKKISVRSTSQTKADIAAEVMADLAHYGIPLEGKSVLDVGSGWGFNARAMQEAGAAVFGVEPDDTARSQAITHSNMREDQIFAGTLQEIPSNLLGTFDLATCFFWNINRNQYDDVMQGLCKSIKPDGAVLIGLHDEVYISDPYGVAVEPLARQYFSKVEATPLNNGHQNRQFLMCSFPKTAAG